MEILIDIKKMKFNISVIPRKNLLLFYDMFRFEN